jgi:hypothetical protein
VSTFSAPLVRVIPRRFAVPPITWSFASSGLRWRRILTIALGVLWLLDAALQYQPYMFTTAFPTEVIAPTAAGNPAWVAAPVRWSAHLLASNVVVYNALFATVQLLLAIGLLLAATVRIALAGSVVWALLVWWLGEGLGGSFAGPVSPLAGLPGAVAIYALIAVLLWPPRPQPHRNPRRHSVASAGLLGHHGARLVWLALWASFAGAALRPANRRPSGLAQSIRAMADGEPRWLAGVNRVVAGAVAHHGTQYSVALALLFALIALSIFVAPLTRIAILTASTLALVMWVVAQDLGAIATGTGTDPNTGPALVLLALCYWPLPHMYSPRHPRVNG